MSEAHSAERREGKPNGKKRARSAAPSRKTEPASSNWKTPLLVVGAGGAVAAVAGALLIATSQRHGRIRLQRREPSFLGVLLKTTLLSAARSFTAHLVEKALLPQLPNFAAAPANVEDSPR